MAKEVKFPRDVLNQRRTVALVGRIEDGLMRTVIGDLLTHQAESDDPIKLLIASSGSDSECALAICDLISHVLMAPVHGITWAECSSSATFILLQCERRLALPHTKFVIHHGTINFHDGLRMDGDAEENLKDLGRDIHEDREQAFRIYKRKLRLDDTGIWKLMAKGDGRFERAISAKQALEIDLINEIVLGNAGIFP